MRQTGGRPRVQMLFTAPDITDDEGLQPVSLEEIKDIASSFDLSQGDSFEETTANIPYATPVESNNRLLSHPEVPQPVYDSRPKAHIGPVFSEPPGNQNASTTRVAAQSPASAISKLESNAGSTGLKSVPKNGIKSDRTNDLGKWRSKHMPMPMPMPMRKQLNTRRRMHKETERGEVTMDLKDEHRTEEWARSVLGYVLKKQLERHHKLSRLWPRAKISVAIKCIRPNRSFNRSTGDSTSAANKSSSLSKEDHGVPGFCPDGSSGRQRGCGALKEAVIHELDEETMLHDYWQKKDELEEKYNKLCGDLEVDEAAEIACYISRAQHNPALKLVQTVAEIKDYYASIRTLLKQQQILEQEGLLADYQRRIATQPPA